MKTYKEFMQRFEEEITNNTTGVAGAGDNPDQTIVMRKKYDRKNKRDKTVKLLRRFLPNKS